MASLVAVISDDPAWTAAAGPMWPVIEGLLNKDPEQRMTAHEAGLVLDDIVRNDSVEDEGTLRIPVSAQPERSVPPDDPPTDDRPGSVERRPARLKKLAAKRSSRPEELPVALAEQALSTEAPRVMEPTAPVSSPSSGLPIPTRLVWAAAVLVAMLGLGWVVYSLTSSDHRSAARLPVTPPRTSAAATPSPTPTPTAVPLGFKRYTGAGFTTVVPTAGWQGALHHSDTPGDLFEGPNSARLILNALGSATNALEAAKAREDAAVADEHGHTPPEVGPATGPGGDTTGARAADMVYEWTTNSGRKHILDRTVVMNGRAYAITVLLPIATWQQDLEHLAPVFSSFRATT
jgi:hypothetical protein